jgi:hypothetical protein
MRFNEIISSYRRLRSIATTAVTKYGDVIQSHATLSVTIFRFTTFFYFVDMNCGFGMKVRTIVGF